MGQRHGSKGPALAGLLFWWNGLAWGDDLHRSVPFLGLKLLLALGTNVPVEAARVLALQSYMCAVSHFRECSSAYAAAGVADCGAGIPFSRPTTPLIQFVIVVSSFGRFADLSSCAATGSITASTDASFCFPVPDCWPAAANFCSTLIASFAVAAKSGPNPGNTRFTYGSAACTTGATFSKTLSISAPAIFTSAPTCCRNDSSLLLMVSFPPVWKLFAG